MNKVLSTLLVWAGEILSLINIGPNACVLIFLWLYNFYFTSENEYEQDGLIVDNIEEDEQQGETEQELHNKKKRKKKLICFLLMLHVN